MNRNDPANRYKKARGNLLAMIVLTVVNIAVTLLGVEWQFLFKAFLPEFAFNLFSNIMPWAGIVIAALLLGLYVLCWALSKNEPAWMTAALVLFALDTAAVLVVFAMICLGGAFKFGMLMEIVFQAWVLYCLITGVIAAKELKGLPEATEAQMQVRAEALPCPAGESAPLRERSPKGRLILRHVTEDGLEIEVVRARGVTELLADGMVYAEFRGIIEPAYKLAACARGHSLLATMDLSALMELYVDGVQVGRKRRVF